MLIATAFYLSIVLVMSITCFVAYGWDKGRAANGSRRVAEQTSHILSLWGGCPASLQNVRMTDRNDSS